MESKDVRLLAEVLSVSTKSIQDAQALGSTVLVPAINLHCATVRNVAQSVGEEDIRSAFFEVEAFYLACGLTRDGRFPEDS